MAVGMAVAWAVWTLETEGRGHVCVDAPNNATTTRLVVLCRNPSKPQENHPNNLDPRMHL